MTKKLTRADLLSLETYHEQRVSMRASLMAHKKRRTLALGEHATLYFEDRMTVQYQIQEMLRAEKIFQAEAIQEELDAYNPLIPDGDNLKATFMLEYEDVDERRRALEKLRGIEDRVYLKVGEEERAFAIADEDLSRENDVKTSAVHFLRFQLSPEALGLAKAGGALAIGIDHPEYQTEIAPVPEPIRASLVSDFD